MIQTKIGARQDSNHSMQVRLNFKQSKKIRKALNIILLQFLILSCWVVTKGHTCFNKFAGSFKYIWRFGTTSCWNGLKRSKDMYQNQSQNLSKIWSFGTNFSFQGVIQNTKTFFFDTDTAWSDIFFKNFFSKCEKYVYLKMLVYGSWNCIHVWRISFSCVFYMLWTIELWSGSLFPRADYEGRI